VVDAVGEVVEIFHLGYVFRDDDSAAVFRIGAEAFEERAAVVVHHVVRPQPRGVAGVVAGVELGAARVEEFDALGPSVVRGVVQRGVARGLDLVDVLAVVEEPRDEISVAVEDGAMEAHGAHEAAAGHGTAAVGFDPDAPV